MTASLEANGSMEAQITTCVAKEMSGATKTDPEVQCATEANPRRELEEAMESIRSEMRHFIEEAFEPLFLDLDRALARFDD